MKALEMIKKLSENRSQTYKKVLICEFLQDINWHKEAEEVYNSIRNYDFLNKLYIASNKNSYSKDTWKYLQADGNEELIEKQLDKLLNSEGNFRVATNPLNKYEAVGYDQFRDFEAANNQYAVISRLCDWGLEEGEDTELVKFALAN